VLDGLVEGVARRDLLDDRRPHAPPGFTNLIELRISTNDQPGRWIADSLEFNVPVPEPSSLAILTVGGLALLRPRRNEDQTAATASPAARS
jgi:hypothetical protein